MWKRILQQPTAILEIFRQIILWLPVMGWVAMTDEQSRATLSVLSAIFAAINFGMVTPNVSVNEQVDEKAAAISRLGRGIVPIIILTLLLASCGGTLRVALEAEKQVHKGLGDARQTIIKVCPDTNLSEGCSVTKSAFNDVLNAAIAYNRGLANKDLTQGVQLVKAIQSFIARVKSIKIPELQPVIADVTYAQGGVK